MSPIQLLVDDHYSVFIIYYTKWKLFWILVILRLSGQFDRLFATGFLICLRTRAQNSDQVNNGHSTTQRCQNMNSIFVAHNNHLFIMMICHYTHINSCLTKYSCSAKVIFFMSCKNELSRCFTVGEYRNQILNERRSCSTGTFWFKWIDTGDVVFLELRNLK